VGKQRYIIIYQTSITITQSPNMSSIVNVLSHLSIFFFISLPLSAPRSDISREVSKTCKLKEMLLITLLLLLSSSCCPLSCSLLSHRDCLLSHRDSLLSQTLSPHSLLTPSSLTETLSSLTETLSPWPLQGILMRAPVSQIAPYSLYSALLLFRAYRALVKSSALCRREKCQLGQIL
jgi:hypothetical protein